MSQDPSITEPNLEECFAVAFEAAIAAGRVIRSKINESQADISQTKLNHCDIVTEIDKQCEDVIISKLKASFPTYEIIAEESANGKELQTNELALKGPVWCVDPIDGTTNFFHGLPFVAVCIGMRYKRDSVLGIVLNPMVNEMFYGIKGRGSYIYDTSYLLSNNLDISTIKPEIYQFNNKLLSSSKKLETSPLRFVSSEEEAITLEKSAIGTGRIVETSIRLKKALILTEVGYDRRNEWVNALLKRIDILLLEEKVRGIRMLGSCALNMCSIAAGRAHIFFEGCNSKYGPKPWDYTAAEVIVIEAGGCVYLPETIDRMDGNIKPIEFDCTKGRVLCCNNISAVEMILELNIYTPSECAEEENEQKE